MLVIIPLSIMEAQQISQLIGAALAPAQAVVCALALIRRLWRVLPYFVAYLVLLVLIEGVRWAVIAVAGANSPTHAWTYWMTQPVLILARGAALADVCRAALGLYAGVWRVARSLLLLAAAFMLGFAAVHTGGAGRISSYLIFLERELEFAVVLSLLLLLVLSRYYGVAFDRPLDGIALGLGFYSSVLILDSSILIGPFALPWWLFSSVRSIAYFIALCWWGYALWAPLPERVPPELSTVESYEQNTRAVSDRMREMNLRLSNLTKR
jgi:hypothetical protein